jgi:hypothetical protein|tara:strand:- start:1833 stop:2069 length:237 start_codon:yes stop_codon:yes gene_type:complete
MGNLWGIIKMTLHRNAMITLFRNEVDNKKWWEIIHILGLSENDKYDMITLEVLGGRVEINQYERPLTNLNGVDKIDRS